jgi:hypothetical protein
MTLRLEAADSSGVEEEYRIYESGVEVRRLGMYGEREPHYQTEASADECWRRLSPAELTWHVQNKTPVAQWLKYRIGWRRLLHACTGSETLQEFGITGNTLDRFAA